MARPKRRRRVAWGSGVHGRRLEGDRYEIEFSWEAFDCSRDLAIRLGDRLIPVPLPAGFPREPIEFEVKDLEVYGSSQSISLSSSPERVPSKVGLSLALGDGGAPVFLMLNGIQLVACLEGGDEETAPLKWDPYGEAGKWTLHDLEVPDEPEKCRPNGRWTSRIKATMTLEWELKKVEIPDHGEFVIHTYEREVDYHWASLLCEGGRWVEKHTNVDRQTESKRVKLVVQEPEWF